MEKEEKQFLPNTQVLVQTIIFQANFLLTCRHNKGGETSTQYIIYTQRAGWIPSSSCPNKNNKGLKGRRDFDKFEKHFLVYLLRLGSQFFQTEIQVQEVSF